MGDESKEQIV